MQRRWWYGPLVLAAGAMFALPAAAQSDAGGGTMGPYIGANVGMNSDDNTGYGAFVGYRINRNFAAEGAYQNTGETDISTHTVDSNAWEASGLGILPLNERFDLYGRLGFYRGNVTGQGQDNHNSDVTYGVGGQYDLTPQVGLRVEWQRYTNMGSGSFGGLAGKDLDMYKVGVLYRFR